MLPEKTVNFVLTSLATPYNLTSPENKKQYLIPSGQIHKSALGNIFLSTSVCKLNLKRKSQS